MTFNKQKPVPEGVMEKILEEFDNTLVGKNGSYWQKKETKDFLRQALQKAGRTAVENWCIFHNENYGDKIRREAVEGFAWFMAEGDASDIGTPNVSVEALYKHWKPLVDEYLSSQKENKDE